MPKFQYVAMDSRGKETKGTLEVGSQNEAITRLKEMGYFPTKVVELDKSKAKAAKKDKDKAPAKGADGKKKAGLLQFQIKIPGLSGRVKPKVLATFTRQLATLVDAGLPLLRGLRVLEKQERNVTLKEIIGQLGTSIEGGERQVLKAGDIVHVPIRTPHQVVDTSQAFDYIVLKVDSK